MVKIAFLKDETFILIALALKISRTPFEKGSIDKLYKECLADRQGSREFANRVMSKFRHLIPGDFLDYAITLEDISRFAAIYLWRNVSAPNQIFGAGLETSFRRISPVSYTGTLGSFGKMTFKSYEEALGLEVPREDAKYILAEGALTRMIFFAPPRYLLKLADILKSTLLPELKEIGEKFDLLVKQKFHLKMHKERILSKWKFWTTKPTNQGIKLSGQGTLETISLDMTTRASLSTLADLVRQRQMLCNIESLQGITRKRTFVIPSSFPEETGEIYRELAKKAIQEQRKRIKKRDPSFVYFLLLGQEARVDIYGKGAGVIGISNARTSGAAHWEIRNKIGIPITRALAKYEFLLNQIGPRCWWQKKCTEPKDTKAMCKAFAQAKGRWKGTLEQLLQILDEPYGTFTI